MDEVCGWRSHDSLILLIPWGQHPPVTKEQTLQQLPTQANTSLQVLSSSTTQLHVLVGSILKVNPNGKGSWRPSSYNYSHIFCLEFLQMALGK